MALDINKPGLVMGVVGAGVMGRGIAQIAAQAGIPVLLYDTKDGAAGEAKSSVKTALIKLAEKGKITAAAADEAVLRITVVDNLAAFARADIVVEAIIEKIEIKHQLFKSLEELVSDFCILATNTSSLSVTEIAAACRLPGRVGGFHFFNPVPLMKIVEVIDGVLTEGWVCDALVSLAERMGHTPVRAKDTPGFIVNHAGRGYVTESLRVLGEGICDHRTVDRILREGVGFRMGPFELLDLTALDVSHPAMEAIYNQYYQEPRLRPSPIARQRLMAGLLGRKVGRGFYSYGGEVAAAAEEPQLPEAALPAVWVSSARPEARERVAALLARLGARIDTAARPADDSIALVLPLGKDATSAALDEGLDPARTLALDTMFGLDTHRTLMKTPLTDPEFSGAAEALFARDGVPVSLIHDSAGFVAQRVLATIVNIACDIVQQRVTTPADLDRAVTLGLGYPQGPLAWGDLIGPANVLTILKEMADFYGDPRYRPSPWLTRRARLGVSLLTAEN